MYLKKLQERRAKAQEEMEGLLNKVKTEEREFTDEEKAQFEELEKTIQSILDTIEKLKKGRNLTEEKEPESEKEDEEDKEQKEAEQRAINEERAFENYIRGRVEERADVNLTTTDNGAVIPSSIADRIIAKVVDICPVYQLAERYNVNGTLTIPLYDEETQSITCAYATEFTDLESTSGKFTNISLTGYLAGALTKVSKSLINNSKFDIVTFVVNKMAESISRFIEKELLIGTDGKITGLRGVTQQVTAGSQTVITSDNLIDTQDEVPDMHQAKAIWIMNRRTRNNIRKLKDSEGNYLLNRDFSAKWGYTLLGKDVYTSDNMSKIGAGNTVAYYGDMSGLAVKLGEDINIEVLREKFATQHAVGIVGYVELDSKVQDAQKISKLVMAGTTPTPPTGQTENEGKNDGE